MKVRLPAGLSGRQLEMVEKAIESCPAYGTLLHPPTVELTIEVEDGVARTPSAA